MHFPLRLAAAVAILPLLGAFRCNERDAPVPTLTLPPATQTGANALGFLLDGQVWRDSGVRYNYATARYDTLRVSARRLPGREARYVLEAELAFGTRDDKFTLTFRNLHQTGTYSGSSGQQPALEALFVEDPVKPKATYTTRRGTPYQVTITRLDTVAQVIAGTFNGTLRETTDTAKTLTMSDGRFDVRYRR